MSTFGLSASDAGSTRRTGSSGIANAELSTVTLASASPGPSARRTMTESFPSGSIATPSRTMNGKSTTWTSPRSPAVRSTLSPASGKTMARNGRPRRRCRCDAGCGKVITIRGASACHEVVQVGDGFAGEHQAAPWVHPRARTPPPGRGRSPAPPRPAARAPIAAATAASSAPSDGKIVAGSRHSCASPVLPDNSPP